MAVAEARSNGAEPAYELIKPGEKVAFVVMQFASTPWNLFDIAAGALRKKGYVARRADHAAEHKAGQRHAVHLWSMLKGADFVLVDITNWNVNVYIELGVAAAWASEASSPTIGVIGAGGGTLPFDVSDLKVHEYSLEGSDEVVADSIVKAVEAALDANKLEAIPEAVDIHTLKFQPGTTDGTSGKAGIKLLGLLPSAVVREVCDPGAAVLATRYVQFLGSLVGEELAGFPGFPMLPEDWRSVEGVVAGSGAEGTVALALPGLEGHAKEVVTQLLQVVHEVDHRVTESSDVASFTPTNRRLAFARALTLPPSKRSSAEVEVLQSVLGNIVGAVDPEPAGRKLPDNWTRGLAAVTRLNRLRAISVSQNSLGTIEKICTFGTTAGPSPLDVVATLGGAYFLGHSIGVLEKTASAYHPSAAEFATATFQGQEITAKSSRLVVKNPEELDPEALAVAQAKVEAQNAANLQDVLDYQDGLGRLSARPEFVFAIEHPFHFRVVLELLSDENRRYAAECILNFQALKETWGREALWRHFSWFRDQLPAVVNLESSAQGLVTDYEQHYVGFGRTPHTSSFMKLAYEPLTRVSHQAWWPGDLAAAPSWVRNMPNTVAATRADVARQQVLGRLWRGCPTKQDLAEAGGDVYAWAGLAGPDHVAALLWDVGRWAGLRFPELVIAELQCGNWLLDAMASRVKKAEADAASLDETGPGGIHDQAPMVVRQTTSVLAILRRYLDEYLDGDDGVEGISATLDQLDARAEGRRMKANLALLRASVDRLAGGLAAHRPTKPSP